MPELSKELINRPWFPFDTDTDALVCDRHPSVECDLRPADEIMLKYDQGALDMYEDPFDRYWNEENGDILVCPACKIPGWLERRDALFLKLHEMLQQTAVRWTTCTTRYYGALASVDGAHQYTDIDGGGFVWFDGVNQHYVDVCEQLFSGEMRLWRSGLCCDGYADAEGCWYEPVRVLPDQTELKVMLDEARALQAMVDDLMAQYDSSDN